MKNSDSLGARIKNLFAAKEKYHKKLAKLSFEKKIEILVNLQKIANGIWRPSKERQMVWEIPSK